MTGISGTTRRHKYTIIMLTNAVTSPGRKRRSAKPTLGFGVTENRKLLTKENIDRMQRGRAPLRAGEGHGQPQRPRNSKKKLSGPKNLFKPLRAAKSLM
jgi:hypothetical protein